MSRGMPEPEALLELGVVAIAVSIAGAVLALLFGRIFGGVDNGRQRAKAAPHAGAVPAERHQHVAVSSPR